MRKRLVRRLVVYGKNERRACVYELSPAQAAQLLSALSA